MPDGLIDSSDLLLDGVTDVEQLFTWLCEHM
jgi:hypothetical protein